MSIAYVILWKATAAIVAQIQRNWLEALWRVSPVAGVSLTHDIHFARSTVAQCTGPSLLLIPVALQITIADW